MYKSIQCLHWSGLTNDESNFTSLVIKTTGHHGGNWVIDHSHHFHVHTLQFQSDCERLKLCISATSQFTINVWGKHDKKAQHYVVSRCTPVRSIASLRVWTTSLPRRPRARNFLLQSNNTACGNGDKAVTGMGRLVMTDERCRGLIPYPRLSVHTGRRMWRPGAVYPPDRCSPQPGSPLKTPTHDQTAANEEVSK